MSLSTNVIQRAESFFMLPAVNWRYTFSTVWRQNKAINFTLSVIRRSSLSNRGLYRHFDTWLGSLRDRIACGITESVPSVNYICAPKELDNRILRYALSLTDCTFVLTENNVPCFTSLHLHPCTVQYVLYTEVPQYCSTDIVLCSNFAVPIHTSADVLQCQYNPVPQYCSADILQCRHTAVPQLQCR